MCLVYCFHRIRLSFQLCMYGRNVFMGYLDMEEKTREAIDENGWLLSGDIAKRNKTGFMFITGRLKGKWFEVCLKKHYIISEVYYQEVWNSAKL